MLPFGQKLIQVGPVNLDSDLRADTGENLVEAMGDELPEVHGDARNFFQIFPDGVDKLFGVPLAITQSNVELHEIGRHGVLVQLCPSGPLGYRDDLRIFPEQLSDSIAQAHGFRERGSRETIHRQNKVSFMKFREKRPSHEGNHGDAQNKKNQSDAHHPDRMLE